LRKVILSPEVAVVDTPHPSNISTAKSSTDASTLELEDIQLMEYWNKIEGKMASTDRNLPRDTTLLSSHEESTPNSFTMDFPDFDVIQTVFVDESKDLSVTVSRIPEQIVHEQQERIEAARFAEQQKVVESIKRFTFIYVLQTDFVFNAEHD